MKCNGAGTYDRDDERVLMLLKRSRDAESLSRVLDKVGVPSLMCAAPEELCLEIERGAGAVLIEEDMFSRRTRECLMHTLQSQPAWSELPVIVLLRHGPETQASHDALLLPGEVTLVELPVRANTVVSVIRNAMRSRSRQYLVRDQLRALNESYHALFDSIDEGFCTLEMIFDETGKPVDYRFLTTNRSFEKHTGLVQAQGKRMRELAPKLEEHWFEIYGRVAMTGESVRFENPAQELHRWFDVHAFRVGQPRERQVAVVFSDITERKQAETELLKAKDELEERVRERTKELTLALQKLQSETEQHIRALDELHWKDQLLMQQGRLAAIGEMIGFIGHQWRQPLNSIGLIVQELSLMYKMGNYSATYLKKLLDRVFLQKWQILNQLHSRS